MGTIRIRDRGDEFRIAITGKFSGECVSEVAKIWKDALAECLARRFTIDISYLTGYDFAGRRLLLQMQRHGMAFAASTPSSLVFLQDLASPRKAPVTFIPEPAEPRKSPQSALALVAAASGE